jgi:hypothetical protein
MKLEVGLVNAPTVLNLCLNVGNPGWVGMFNPVYGRRWDRGLLLDSTAL